MSHSCFLFHTSGASVEIGREDQPNVGTPSGSWCQLKSFHLLHYGCPAYGGLSNVLITLLYSEISKYLFQGFSVLETNITLRRPKRTWTNKKWITFSARPPRGASCKAKATIEVSGAGVLREKWSPVTNEKEVPPALRSCLPEKKAFTAAQEDGHLQPSRWENQSLCRCRVGRKGQWS